MVNIFCTKKLESFVKVEDRTLESYTSENNWNGHLISVDRKKCLYFIHKRTLYSVLLLNILKKDLLQLDALFFDGLVRQLKLDELYSPKLDNYLMENFKSIKLFKTDNDQSTLGTLRDDIMHLNAYIKDKPDKLKAANDHKGQALNKIPIGTRKYKYAKEIMELEVFRHLI